MDKIINKFTSMVATLLISGFVLLSCSGDVENKEQATYKTAKETVVQELVTQESHDFDYKESANQTEHRIKGEQVFKISNKDFFKSDSILEWFSNKEQHKLGFVVPLDFSLGANSIYIPNRTKRSMYNYSKEGKFLGELKLPHSYSPDYFALLANNTLIINDFHLDSIVQITSGKVERKAENSDLRFSALGDNFLFRKKTSFFDAQGYFNGEYKFTYLYSTFDYMLIDESSFGLIYYDEEGGKGIAEIINKGGVIRQKITLELPLDWEDYNGVKILKISDSECLFVLMAGISDLNSNKLVHYNFNSGETAIHSLEVDYEGPVFIGEGADLWSSGVLFRYSEKEKAIYSLFTGVEFIYLYKYSLQ